MRRASDLAIPKISKADLEVIRPGSSTTPVSSGRARPKFKEADVEKDIRGLGVAGTAALKISSFEREEDLLYLWDTEDELREEVVKVIGSFNSSHLNYFVDQESETKESVDKGTIEIVVGKV